MTKKIAKRWFNFFAKEEITRADNQPYLSPRLFLFRCRWFSIMVHRFVGNDDLCLHDHPWHFATFILWGGYWETFQTPEGQQTKWRRPFSMHWYPAEHVHRIELEGGRPALTFVITLQKIRNWGFHTPSGWIWHGNYYHKTHCPDG